MQYDSRIAPQQPKNEMTNTIEPNTISRMDGATMLYSSLISRSSSSFTSETAPITMSAMPHSCTKKTQEMEKHIQLACLQRSRPLGSLLELGGGKGIGAATRDMAASTRWVASIVFCNMVFLFYLVM
uniref:Uncharacterized protein n=1 Tax=Anopheles farauti TaxID=69004 RepID=A0A182QN15_9DIPT